MIEGWRELALCRQVDPDLFFPEGKGSNPAIEAKRVCRACEVQAECLMYALTHRETFGVWGGHSARARLRLARLAGLSVPAGDDDDELDGDDVVEDEAEHELGGGDVGGVVDVAGVGRVVA